MNLKEAMKGKLSEKEAALMQRAYDVIGNIAIIDVPDELKRKEKMIAAALLKQNNIRAVLKKSGKIKGRLRTRKLIWLAGEKTKETEHHESGCRLRMNVETCYFSPRLSNDRLEVAKQVKPGEKVLVMFSGIGPYPIVIAKNSKAKEIYAIEINREASKYARENVMLNKLGNVHILQGDVKRVIPSLVKKVGKFDRIMMARPQLKDMFLKEAFMASRKGTVINLHDFVLDEGAPESTLMKIEDALNDFSKGKWSRGRYRITD